MPKEIQDDVMCPLKFEAIETSNEMATNGKVRPVKVQGCRDLQRNSHQWKGKTH
jgi:hypothetical protein